MRVGLLFASALVVAGVVVACNPEGPPPVAPVELSVPPMSSLPDGGGISIKGGPAPGGGDARCTARLAPEPIQTPSGCELDERLTKGAGQLLFPCRGDGPIEAVFDEHRFEGTMQGGHVVMNLRTELEWHDKCLWETRQELRGALEVRGGKASGSLTWSYSERFLKVGPRGSCDTPYRATADIEVE